MSWRPIITDPTTRARIVATLREIRDALVATPATTFDEHLDRALLFAFLAQDDTVPDEDDGIGAALSRGVSLFVAANAPASLHKGATGVGWIAQLLAGGETADTLCGAIDGMLMRSLGESVDYDLVSGLVGFGVYALGCNNLPLVERILDQLISLARPHGGGLAWFTPPDRLPPWHLALAPDGYWNLGLAHGIPGVIALLARFVTAGIERARPVLDGAVAYLLAAEPPRVGRYPSWHPHDGGPTQRLAWCYGDLGVSLALLSAAHARDRGDWRTEAIALGHGCAATSFEDARVHDTGLCHGAAGAAHLFGRLHHATGEVVFAAAALRWLDQIYAMRRAEPIAGFPNLTDEAWQADATLLTGAVGVGLALHALISEIEPTWDRLLLVDVDPQ